MSSAEPQLWIVMSNWQRFQHYTDRDPPWIKNYTRLMSDDNYLSLSPHLCAVLHRLWLEYARSACRLRADTGSLSSRLGLRVTRAHLEALNHAGFLEILLAPLDASASRAVEQTETETETEKDKSKSESGQAEASYAGLDWNQLLKEMP